MPTGHTAALLLVEAHEDYRIIYRALLEHHAYRVVIPASDADVSTIARQEQPLVLILDVGPAGPIDWAVVRHLKSDAATRDMAIVALTAPVRPDDRVRALELGCEVCLPNPCEPQQLLAAVEALIGDLARRAIDPPVCPGETGSTRA